MKSSILKQSHAIAWCCGMLAGSAALLLWASPATSGEKQTAEVLATMVGFEPGETAVTPSGNLRITGMKQVLMFISDNPLFTGRFTWVGNVNVDAEFNGVANCKNTFEVGTWDEGVFTPSNGGGVVVGTAQATGNMFGPFEVRGAGHGIAGEIEGLQVHIEGRGDLYVQHYTVNYLDPHAEK